MTLDATFEKIQNFFYMVEQQQETQSHGEIFRQWVQKKVDRFCM